MSDTQKAFYLLARSRGMSLAAARRFARLYKGGRA